MPQPIFTLGKKERLKSRKQIDLLFAEGKSFGIFPYRVYFTFQQANSHQVPLQAAFSVSKKFFKKATHRNRIKRLMREAYRLQKNELYSKLISMNAGMTIFFIYTGKELPEYEMVYSKMLVVLNKLADHIVQPTT